MSRTLDTILLIGTCVLVGLGIFGCNRKQPTATANEIKAKGGMY